MSVNISVRRPRRGPPRDHMTISWTKRHGLGWALFRPGEHVAHEFGGFVLPEYVFHEEVMEWADRRMRLYNGGHWSNPGRYDWLLDEGLFPAEVREVDMANRVRRRTPNGPAILAVLHGTISGSATELRPSRDCPVVDGMEAYRVNHQVVAIKWMSRK